MTTITKLPDGGAAFARNEVWNPDWREIASVGQTGMSLRDYIAVAAVQGLVQTDHWNFPEVAAGAEIMPPEIAKESYVIADAMLKARGL